MNIFVADPEWGWWIILYFFLGGIAAGAYFLASLIELVGGRLSRDLPRVGYWIAFPLIVICGMCLTVDLDRPERFWHMLFRSGQVHEALREGWPAGGWGTMIHAPLFKYWSPMSIGSWALTLFGLCSGLSLLGSLWPEGRLANLFRHSILGRVLQVVGSAVGFFVAAYTGTLLSATNQPMWSDSAWIAPLFLASAASTGAAAMILLAWLTGVGWPDAAERLERTDVFAIVLELLVFIGFLLSLGVWFGPVWSTPRGKLLVVGTLLIAILLPLALYLWRRFVPSSPVAVTMLAALLALGGGLIMRYAILRTPPQILADGPELVSGLPQPPVGTPGSGTPWPARVSPEDGRQAGEAGADPMNRPGELQPRSKVFGEE
jgi:formate-dependent nitrite reductase membrane component NrfD